MKILLLIDNLSSGGAQRQIVTLAKLLSEHDIDVRVMCYFPSTFFEQDLIEHEIPILRVSSNNKFTRIIKIRSAIRRAKPDAVIAFLSTPSILAELASLPSRQFCLLVSERTGKVSPPTTLDRNSLSVPSPRRCGRCKLQHACRLYLLQCSMVEFSSSHDHELC